MNGRKESRRAGVWFCGLWPWVGKTLVRVWCPLPEDKELLSSSNLNWCVYFCMG